MNRRSFFKRLGVAVVAVPALTDVVLCTEPLEPIMDMTYNMNPDWENARMEVSFHGSMEMHRKILENIARTNPYADLCKKETFGA